MNEMQTSAGAERDNNELAGVIGLGGRLPASWRALGEPLSDAELAALNDSNGVLLNAIAVVDAQSQNDLDEPGTHNDLLRLEAKVDLLLGLVTQVLAIHQPVPPLVKVFLSAQHLTWSDALVPAGDAVSGQLGVIELYVYPLIAVPLRLPVRIEQNGQALILGLSAHARNGLEKFLFRQHRRAIADARQQKI